MSRFSIHSMSRRAALSAFAATPVVLRVRQVSALRIPRQASRPAQILHADAGSGAGAVLFRSQAGASDITEGHPGVPMRMRFVVMEAANCAPLPGARVDVWQTSADGYYSGYPGQGDARNVDTVGGTFMRGTQIADARGEASSAASIPDGIPAARCMCTSRFSSTTRACSPARCIFRTRSASTSSPMSAHTVARPPATTFNGNDGLALSDTTRGGFCDIREEADHYLATLIVGVNREAATAHGQSPTPPVRPRAIVPGIEPAKQKNG